MAADLKFPKTDDKPWGAEQERSIVSLALDMPDFFNTIHHLVEPEHFRQPDARFIISRVKALAKKYGHVPERALIEDHVKGVLTDDNDWQPIIKLLERPLSPREAPMIRDGVVAWAKQQQIEVLYTAEGVAAIDRGDVDAIGAIIEKAKSFDEEGDGFFKLSELRSDHEGGYVESPWPDLNSGAIRGIKVGEVVALSGSTGDGKSTLLMEVAADHVKRGIHVAYIDFENDADEALVSMTAAMLKDENIFLTADVARKIVAEAEAKEGMGTISVCPLRKRMIPFTNIPTRIEMMEKRTGIFHPVVVLDYIDKIRDPKLTKEHGQWLAQEMVFEEFQCWCAETGRVGYTGLQINREGQHKKAKGKARTGADVSGAYGKIQVTQWHLVLERGPQGPVLVVDKARRTGRLKGAQFEYAYVESKAEGSERGFVRYLGARSFKNDWAIKRERLVEILKSGNLEAMPGLVRDSSQGQYGGHLAISKEDLRKWCGFDSTLDEALKDESLVVAKPGSRVRVNGGNARRTWVVFKIGVQACVGGTAHPLKSEETGAGA